MTKELLSAAENLQQKLNTAVEVGRLMACVGEYVQPELQMTVNNITVGLTFLPAENRQDLIDTVAQYVKDEQKNLETEFAALGKEDI